MEKVPRRGFHIFREYSADPLSTLFVENLMMRDGMSIPGNITVAQAHEDYFGYTTQKFRSYPVVDENLDCWV